MHIHLIAIGGSAMHNLALALAEKGHRVSGSDDEIFEPSKSRLKAAGLLPEKIGWDPAHIHHDLDCVILGMHARRNNPELIKAQELGLPVYSYPEFIYQQCQDKTRVVIAGSHGKTSITAMVLHAMHYHGRDLDYMVGAQLEGFDTMVRLTDHNEFVLLEGDEYLSSPLDARPKFFHYQANIALLSGIAWDHINVFPQYEDYRAQFDLLLERIQAGGVVVYNALDEEVQSTVDSTKNEIKKFAYTLPNYRVENGLYILETEMGDVPLKIFGKHNMSNLEGARWICNQMGLMDDDFYEAMGDFKGASRRLEPILEKDDLLAFRDYAHAPSKVAATVSATKETFPDHQVVAFLELHTFSSLNENFLPQYAGSLAAADEAMVYYNPQVVAHKKLPALSPEKVQQAFEAPELKVVQDSQALLDRVRAGLPKPSVLLLMSSGNYDGLNWREELSALPAG